MNQSIAIAINTFNRKKSFYEGYRSVVDNTDTENIFVVDDCSDENYFTSDYRFENRVGISKAKNMALEMCYESSANHFFILDDDVRILKKDWWKPYVESGEHHLAYTFLKPHKTYGGINSFLLSNGCMLYFTRECIDRVGGFDTRFNNKYEHVNLSQRIYNAGLTKHIHQDVINSDELIYCLDQDNDIERSFSKQEMNKNLRDGYDLFRSQANSSEYIEFRT